MRKFQKLPMPSIVNEPPVCIMGFRGPYKPRARALVLELPSSEVTRTCKGCGGAFTAIKERGVRVPSYCGPACKELRRRRLVEGDERGPRKICAGVKAWKGSRLLDVPIPCTQWARRGSPYCGLHQEQAEGVLPKARLDLPRKCRFKKRVPITCGICSRHGHNVRTCPAKGSSDEAHL